MHPTKGRGAIKATVCDWGRIVRERRLDPPESDDSAPILFPQSHPRITHSGDNKHRWALQRLTKPLYK
jgi:hypothetical protein